MKNNIDKFMLDVKEDKNGHVLILKDKIQLFEAKKGNNQNLVLIYVHGMGSNKFWITRFYKVLLDKNIAVLAYDNPAHGFDTSSFKEYTLENCIDYLNTVISYAKENYPNAKICLFGSSFGGFVILNRLMQKENDIFKTVLMCPAYNLTDIFARKAGNNTDFFKEKEYAQVLENVQIYKEAYPSLKEGNDNVKNHKFHNIAIIQGDKDKTTELKDITWFCEKNNLKLKVLNGGYHELYGFEKEITDFIWDSIN